MSTVAPAEPPTVPVLRLERVRKEFGGIVALADVTLEAEAGEALAVVGGNGAGKSTVVKISSGAPPPTGGRKLIDGEEVAFADPSAAQKRGIQVVFQDLALAEQQPVYMNLFLGRELVTGPLRRLDRRRMIRETRELAQAMDVRIPSVTAAIRDLSGGQRQAVATARPTPCAGKLL